MDNGTDNLTIRVEGTELVISDPDNTLGTLIPGATQNTTNEVRVDVRSGMVHWRNGA